MYNSLPSKHIQSWVFYLMEVHFNCHCIFTCLCLLVVVVPLWWGALDNSLTCLDLRFSGRRRMGGTKCSLCQSLNQGLSSKPTVLCSLWILGLELGGSHLPLSKPLSSANMDPQKEAGCGSGGEAVLLPVCLLVLSASSQRWLFTRAFFGLFPALFAILAFFLYFQTMGPPQGKQQHQAVS